MCIFSAGHLHTINKIDEEKNRAGGNNNILGSHLMTKIVQNIAALILEPQSLRSVFNSYEYRHMVEEDRDFFVYRVPYLGLRELLADEAKLRFCGNIFKGFVHSGNSW